MRRTGRSHGSSSSSSRKKNPKRKPGKSSVQDDGPQYQAYTGVYNALRRCVHPTCAGRAFSHDALALSLRVSVDLAHEESLLARQPGCRRGKICASRCQRSNESLSRFHFTVNAGQRGSFLQKPPEAERSVVVAVKRARLDRRPEGPARPIGMDCPPVLLLFVNRETVDFSKDTRVPVSTRLSGLRSREGGGGPQR